MAKKARRTPSTTGSRTSGADRVTAVRGTAGSTPTGGPIPSGDSIPVVSAKQPCPCGSGRRYKACHGAVRETDPFVARPFEGLTGECDWVALREIVPAATVPVRLDAAHGGGTATVATVLPMAWPGMRRADGTVLVGLQTTAGSADPSRDVAAALIAALAAEPGSAVGLDRSGPEDPRLQDVLDPGAPLEITVHKGFDFWVEDLAEVTAEVRDSLERANAAAVPTARLESVEAAYWCEVGERRHLRWVLPHPEDALFDALARLHAAGATRLVEGSRYLGSFRAHGLLVPVWDLPRETEALDLEKPAATFADRLGEALATDTPLTLDERRARAGVVSRQITLR